MSPTALSRILSVSNISPLPQSHMLAAFQQSIENLTSRLELETRRAESRERELEQLRPKPAGQSNGHHGGSYSDFSDCETDQSPFDRKKSPRRSWKVWCLVFTECDV